MALILDQDGKLFELDVFKSDFSPLLRWPTQEELHETNIDGWWVFRREAWYIFGQYQTVVSQYLFWYTEIMGDKRIPAKFYRTEADNKPVREWLADRYANLPIHRQRLI
ncbi:MAG: hypothetical protein AAGI69_05995 [Cyanobacteria bacterium P01_H01_bin.21]